VEVDKKNIETKKRTNKMIIRVDFGEKLEC
jgi:hypothetical protein